MPSEPGMAASIARSQLLSHAGHIGRQARQAWATGPETVARVAASATIDEQGERFLASLHSLAAEDEFIGTMSTKKPKQRRKRPGSAAGPVAKKGVKRPLEPTLSEGTTVGSTSSQGSAESGTQAQMSAADGDGGDAPLQTVAAAAAAEEGAEDGELGGVNKKQRVEASGAGPNEGARRSDTDAVAMDTVTAAPVKLEQAQVSATTGADATDVITAAHSNGSSGNVKSSGDGDNANGGPEGEAADDEAQDDEEESSSEEELVPRATRSRSTLSDVALGDTAEYESGGENDVEDERKARNNEKEFVGQRELEYTWRPLGTPLDAPGFGSTVLRCSTHSAAAEVLLAITDVLMLVTRKDRVFANKKLPGLKSWLETHGVPMWYYGFRPRGWTGNEERSDSQEYRGNMTPCLAYENVRFVLRWLCGSKARTGDLVASWKAAGGRQWLQAEIEHSNGFSAPGNGGRGAGDTAVAALRARNHRQTEQERFTKETSQKERLVQALPRWYQLLCRATECAAATAAASASGEMTSGSVNVTAAECENPPDWPAARRPLWLRELHGRTVAQVIGVEEVLSELTRALRRAGGFPLYRSPRPGHPPPTELPADTSLAATAKESEIAELPAADQSLGECAHTHTAVTPLGHTAASIRPYTPSLESVVSLRTNEKFTQRLFGACCVAPVRLVVLTGTDAEAAAGSTTGSDQQSDAEMAAVAKLREWLHRT